MTKLNLSRITAICIDGSNIDKSKEDNYKIIFNHMLSVAEYYDFIFVSNKGIDLPGVTNIKIDYFDIQGYSDYCIKELDSIVKSEYCLVFQSDGFIVNTELWDDNFYNYDYIGAPWPLHFGGWVDVDRQVGNGGFSLRSKRLLEITSKFEGDFHHEDTYIVFEKRKILEEKNIKIAPLEIAMKFSVENPINDSHNIHTTFGFHSKSMVNDVFLYKIKK